MITNRTAKGSTRGGWQTSARLTWFIQKTSMKEIVWRNAGKSACCVLWKGT